MLTAHTVTVLTRLALVPLCAAIGFWAIDPFHVLDGMAFAHTPLAYCGALYLLTVMGGVALPHVRRNDIALIGIALAGLLECVRAILGADASLASFSTAVVGVAAAWAPGAIEQLRRYARTHPFLSFRDIHDLQGRGRRRSAVARDVSAEVRA